MKFIAKKPREGINVSDEHPLVEAGTLIVGLTAIFTIVALALIFIIEVALYFVSTEAEAELFSGWIPADLATVSSSDDRREQTQMLVDRLAAHWAETPYEFRVEIDDSDVANAMALPGGLIIVTMGLLDQVESENELAFVLGHELGHFRNRDHLRALGRGLVLSLFFAVITGNDVAGIGISATDIALRGFSREQETRADAFGLAIVHSEYGHVNQAARLFERWGASDEDSSAIASYLSTHPRPGDRVEQLQNIAARDGWRTDGQITPLAWPAP
ncbi:MAG: M48 family metallopeptidase [Gammaproteobacteria bacterium]|nr:M48 family metallopeptidase [Gammaproteobacteria bacterium]NND48271.1 M48 family metallopeptidase [Woeseiaceae bacterium]